MNRNRVFEIKEDCMVDAGRSVIAMQKAYCVASVGLMLSFAKSNLE